MLRPMAARLDDEKFDGMQRNPNWGTLRSMAFGEGDAALKPSRFADAALY